MLLDIEKINELDDAELVFTKTDGTKYNFNIFVLPLKFVEKFYSYEITLNEAKDNQDKLEKLIFRLNNYTAKKKKLEEKNKVLNSAGELFHAREDIIVFFENGIFPFKGNVFKTKEEESKEESKEEKFKKYINNAFTFIEEKSENINNDLITKFFIF